jgi:LPXTG-motif cell wall-anchored protein
MPDGELRKISAKSIKESGAFVSQDGEPINLTTLKAGQQISATVVTKAPPATITEQEMKVFASAAPPPPPRPARVAVTKTEQRPATLPKTASPVPLIGLAGLALMAAGGSLTVLRRLRRR